MKATWNGQTLAESDATIVVEGNHYFPRESLASEHFAASDKTTICSWKGEATYFRVRVGDAENRDAAWTYVDPKPAAAEIKDYVAFWRGVEVSE
ncbi:MAG: DUF427 domain-containing protein [Proteobacteria bacterium]|nr:DUF427 domain-containing protein [Pseudomonadota bacterium]